MERVLVTGVTGFIGRAVAQHFAGHGRQVFGIGTRPPENAPLPDLSGYTPLILPSIKLAEVVNACRPDVCVHCAGRASVELSMSDPGEDFDAAVPITFNILDTLRKHAPSCRLILVSSAAVYGNPRNLPISERQAPAPISPYGFHKLISEVLCREFTSVYGLKTSAVRIFSTYGPGLRRQVLWDICRKSLREKVLRLRGTGSESRDFIHVRDAGRAIFLIAERASGEGEAYNLASGEETTVRKLAELILEKLNVALPIEFDGMVPVGTPRNWRADISLITGLGYVPRIALEEGIDTYVSWAKAELG
jgi:UDP-glucose 4-epimerase